MSISMSSSTGFSSTLGAGAETALAAVTTATGADDDEFPLDANQLLTSLP